MTTSVTERATVVPTDAHHEESRPRRLARPILIAFIFTFMAARVLAFLIVSRRVPDVYLNLLDSLQYADRLLLRIQIIEQSQPPLR